MLREIVGFFHKPSNYKRSSLALTETAIPDKGNYGFIFWEGGTWRAYSAAGIEIPAHRRVHVVRQHSGVLALDVVPAETIFNHEVSYNKDLHPASSNKKSLAAD